MMTHALAARTLLALTVALAPGCRRIDDPPGLRGADRRGDPGSTPTEARDASARPPDLSQLADRVSSSVVSVVSTVRRQGSDGRPLRGIGSGVVVSADGRVLTNEHVVAHATDVDVELSSRQRVGARIIAADPLLDLALLQLEAPVENLVPLPLRSEPARVGEWVMAVGQPYALGNTVTVGVVSGLGRDYSDLGRPPGLRPDGVWSFIQTDASINIGNSGGPLVDLDARILGITTAVRRDGQGLAFAVPAPMARRFLDDVAQYGHVRHPKLGIRADNAGPDAFAGRMQVVRVTHVDDTGPGADAGLESGDLILSVDGRVVTRVSEVAFQAQLAGVGTAVALEVLRGDTRRQMAIVPSEG
jgi:S1-C subfamily serine protease